MIKSIRKIILINVSVVIAVFKLDLPNKEAVIAISFLALTSLLVILPLIKKIIKFCKKIYSLIISKSNSKKIEKDDTFKAYTFNASAQ